MKKLYTLVLSAFIGISAFAQTQPERIVVHESNGSYHGYLAERVDSITFPKIEGRVAADLEIISVHRDSLFINVTRTPQCVSFKLASIPAVIADRFEDDFLANYVDSDPNQMMFYQDFTKGKLQDPSWEADTKYVLTTVGYDNLGIPCSVVRVPFSTPKIPLVGNPKVQTVVDEVLEREYSCSFYPNEDVAGYAVVAEQAGLMQQKYESWAPTMGFKNFGEMVKRWGIQAGKDEIGHTWNGQTPNTEYEIFVQAWDVNGTFADCDTIKVKTKMKGGEGAASVDVKLGDYKMADWEGQQLPSQIITFTPNDQSSCYRFQVATKEAFDKDPEGFKNDLAQDPPFPIDSWFFYEPLTSDFQINPNTEFVVLSAAKNGLNVWGEVKVEYFKTPAEVSGKKALSTFAPQTTIGKREIKNNTIYIQQGTVPSFNAIQRSTKMTLE